MAIQANIQNIKYDINQSYGQGNYITSFTSELESIEQSINNILLTPKGTRIRNRSFGSGLHKYLFLPMTQGTASSIVSEIYRAITNSEFRVNIILSETIITMNHNTRQYEIELPYVVVRTLETRLYRFAVDSQA